MDLYFFDFDTTLYTYDSRKRLPALSLASGVSQYHLAKTWWESGFEIRAESGEWPTAAEYLAEFGRFDARPEDTFFVDDSAANVAGAASVGIHTHHLVYRDRVPQLDGLHEAIERFAARMM
ncbi:hypothetical protein [Lacisediminihabitans profunda]|uniref:HAD family phosphatase n=1 Tax=Lacisediminihabitans profunda TaxID=2594790 RepID=A0A5C8UMF1_9MICO|nr:hypothetical protein [Lacisediminihabitans profunda]TXN28549.1 hypothetical protein FVP33_17085 [Lacisediminihabitans profunda]